MPRGEKPVFGKIRAVVFDLDGVLVDSTPCHRAAFEDVLAPLGIHDFDYHYYAGWRTIEVVEAEMTRAGRPADPALAASLAEQKTRLARAKLAATNPVLPGCPAVLEQLVAAGFILALASSGSKGTVDAFLETNRCRAYFRSVLTGGDVTRAKPDPEIYLKTFEALQLPAAVCAVIEDAVSGIEAAIRAGAIPIGITGTCIAAILREAGAVQTVENLLEIPALLSKI